MMKTAFGVGLLSLWVSTWGFGQFHTKENPAGTASHVRAGAARTTNPGAFQSDINEAGANTVGGTMILPEGSKEAFAQWNPRLVKTQGRQIEVWARRIEHSDGSYTESIESNEKQESNSIEQITRSANGTVLQKRLVRLDRYKRPAEVLIRDGRGKFKYRGLMIYDQVGRFAEEQIFDANGTLIRRKVQEYTSDGFPKPVRSWDYVANVPEDLKLVITRNSEDPTDVDRGSSGSGERKNGWFARKEGGAAPENPEASQRQPSSAESDTSGTSPEKRRGLSLGRLFGGGGKRED